MGGGPALSTLDSASKLQNVKGGGGRTKWVGNGQRAEAKGRGKPGKDGPWDAFFCDQALLVLFQSQDLVAAARVSTGSSALA